MTSHEAEKTAGKKSTEIGDSITVASLGNRNRHAPENVDFVRGNTR